MKRIKCLIADDEMLSLEVLENYISKLDNYQLTSKCKNGIEVFNTLKTTVVDVMFLDIHMPQLSGLELVKSLKDVPPVIFTTAFRDYAVEGYELNAVDYLLKPISFNRFLKAIDKFETISLQINSKRNQLQDVTPSANPFIYIKSAKKTVKVFLKDIIYIEGAKDFVKIKTTQGEVTTYQSLQDFEQRLPSTSFLRVHRSFIIALERIRAYNAEHIEVDGAEIPIGQSYQKLVTETLRIQ